MRKILEKKMIVKIKIIVKKNISQRSKDQFCSSNILILCITHHVAVRDSVLMQEVCHKSIIKCRNRQRRRKKKVFGVESDQLSLEFSQANQNK